MSREDIQKLLGGYATGTLSAAERSALFEAALEDQELFDALAKEEALRDVLDYPSARQQLIAALSPAREPYAARFWRVLRRPAALAMAGGAAVLLIVAGLVLRQTKHPARRDAIVAEAVPPSAPSLKAIEPPAVARKPKRPARLPAGRPVPAPEPVAGAAPPPPPMAEAAPAAAPTPPAEAASALADTAEARRQMFPATQAPSQNIITITRDGAPMAGMVRAKTAHSAAAKPAVAHTLLLKDANGAYAAVPAGTVFHVGDSVRIQVEPSDAGYIFLFQRAAPNTGWTLVASRSVEKDQRCVLPPTDALQSGTPVRLELLLALSRVAHVDVDALASQAQASSKITIEFR